MKDYKSLYENLLPKYQNLVELCDKYYGTPCEQIRHEEEKKEYARIQVEKDRDQVINKLQHSDGGRPGCTYGDTDYDSLSAHYGYNLAIDNAKEYILSTPINLD